ncbi:Membrane-bound transcription factor site-2 protease [Trachymyrmex zeteki]|uniref:Membrane-bound transcription factor site-2 protease n=1 Tax=Mycetomoellerius zeteki TaxID=64791 RepID=A0A151XDU3_9HYME|nr:PREDICTED: membrane-bound transcription factor site-2 protease [Trachymyrmex zeteki]KYQ58541.1 Membrane-bound transcription factor site-2 protease [Trachymyrmex zeteki]
MDALSVLIAIALIHCSLFFFDTLFKSCSHFPYLYFLENTGLEIQILRVKWFTTAFNRKIIKLGLDCSRFWIAWFNAGVIISIILLPIAVIIILKMTFNMWLAGSSSDTGSGVILEPMLPGVDIPFNEIGYYVTTLAICSIFHELGHALAAAREDVQLFGLGIVIVFTIPIAYVHISNEQLVALPLRNQLRIACAGIWHNIILATIAAAILVFSTWLWAPLYNIGSGVYVKTILPNSPVLGPTGLLEYDVINKLNNCPIKHSEDWYDCMLQAVQHSAPGYCVKQSFVQDYDESVPAKQKTNGAVNCCTTDSEINGNLCFEYIEGPQTAPLHLPPHSCLPVRAMLNQSQNFCQASHECLSHDTHCMKPSLDNVTKIIQIKRKTGKDVLFFGHPADIYRTVDVSDWVPKYSFLYPELPESFALLCKYITVFSAGLAIINIVPCFFLDGQYILNIIVLYLLNSMPHNRNIRESTVLTITSIGTLLFITNLMYLLINKLL